MNIFRFTVGNRRGAIALAAALAACAIAPATALAEQPLTVAVQGEGTVVSSPAAIECPGACKATFKDFERVELTAKPAPGWQLKAWGGDCSAGGACAVVMDTARDVKATFAASPKPEPAPAPKPDATPAPAPAPEPEPDATPALKPDVTPGPKQVASFDDKPPGSAKDAIKGVAFPPSAEIFAPRTTVPSSFPRALGLDACRTTGKGSSIPMTFDVPLRKLTLSLGFDDLPAPAGGTYGRLVGFDDKGKQISDSGDVALSRPNRDAAGLTTVTIDSPQAAISTATVFVGQGTLSHDTGARCAIVDDVNRQFAVDALQPPVVEIATPQEGTAFRSTSDVGISGRVRAAHGVAAFCVTVGDVRAMPATCNWIVRVTDPHDLSRTVDEPLRDGEHFDNLPPIGLSQGANHVTVWVRDHRDQVASDSVDVEVTGQPVTYDARVGAIEVTQAVQQFTLPRLNQYARANGQIDHPYYEGAYSGVLLAARGATTVRVLPQFVYGGRDALAGLTARLWGYRSGSPLPGGPLAPIGGPQTLMPSRDQSDAALYRQRSDANGAFTFALPTAWTQAGDLSLVAELVPPPDTPRLREDSAVPARYNNAAGITAVPFVAMQSYRPSIVALDSTFVGERPGRAPGHGGTRACTSVQGGYQQMLGWFSGLQAILPLGIDQLRIAPYVGCVDVTAIHRCDASDQVTGRCPNIRNAANQRDVSAELLAATRRLGGDRGIAAPVFGLGGEEPGAGSANGGYAVSSTDSRPMGSVAHEFGHLLGLRHAGCPMTGDQVGVAWPGDGVGLLQGVGLDRRPGSGIGGPLRILAPNQTVTGATCTPAPNTSCTGVTTPQFVDWMSYCEVSDGDYWISTRNWTNLINALRVGAARPPVGVGGARAPERRAAGAPTLLVTALAGPAGGRVVGVQRGHGAVTPSVDASPYRVVLRSQDGRVLSDTGVSVEPPSEPTSLHSLVSVELPVVPATRVELVRDGQVLDSRARSARPPTVTVVAPEQGARVGSTDAVTVRWRAADADGDALSTTVEYSADGGRTYRAIGSTHAGSMRLPARLFSHTSRGRVRVTVNDGFGEASATSRPFAAAGAAPVVRIVAPARVTKLANDASLTLTGQAYDDAGALLAGKRLRWYADRKLLGTGADLSVHGLPAGTRRIRLLALDGARRRASASIAVRVFAADPQFTVLRAPARVARSARSVRLRVAAAIPARLAVAGLRASVDRKVRTLVVAVRSGRGAIVLALRLSAGGRTTERQVRILRG